ncbi:Flp family type IVb pilin [Kerstersia gyiorum]|uniref:Flp family type IVb pilin n=1 Tax=Kerstersia gyiorum TaxID=206506 RepID=UPI002432C6F3|nr:Flp family type IVb pilin [Kerstersia gyiorum]MCH4271115.1 Flp family type IVb pilin [Kerstersia gyiorum]MCI1228450.1 Flp family type IVb pilin [Kerstersia gyiorum]
MKEQIVRFLKDEDGATAIEYGLIAGLIAVVIIAALAALGDELKGAFESISGAIADPSSVTTP